MNVALRSSLNFISLCTGGGGLDFGVELAIPDARPVVLVEGEAWSVATLVQAMEARLMAPAPVWSNVRTFDGRPWRGLVDGLIGGIPCQPHSLAGKRGGQDDERDLWSPTRRIIVQSGAWWVLIENVRGMLSAKEGQTAGAHRVWRDLQRLGFAVEVGLFTAAEVGASHERERVFILAVADRTSLPRWTGSTAAGLQCAEFNASNSGCDVGHPDSARLEGRRHEPDGRAGERAIGAIGANGGELADATGEGRWGISIQQRRQNEAGTDISRRSAELDNAGGERRSAGRQTNGNDERHEPDATGEYPLVNAMRAGLHAGAHTGVHRGEESTGPRHVDPAGSSGAMVDAIGSGHDGQSEDAIGREIGRAVIEWPSRDSFPALYPPRPSDIDGWRRVLAHSPHLEPAVRRMADGVAARLDLSGPHAARIERLRMLGNGVVPLEAAYALRTLATRLAVRSDGAKRLVRMMVDP